MTCRLTLRQSRVLNCFRRVMVVLGGPRTGKSYAAETFAIERLLKGENVIFLMPTPPMCRDTFYHIGTVLRNIRKLEKRLVIDFLNHTIEYGDFTMSFATPDGDYDSIVMFSKGKPCTLVADAILDIPQLLCHTSYLENRYGFKFKKILITGRHSKFVKECIKSIDNKIKIFVWKGEC